MTINKKTFDEELKLTFDALRNSGLAVGLFIAAQYVSDHLEASFDNLWFYWIVFLWVKICSVILQFLNASSYCRQMYSSASSKKLFFIGISLWFPLLFVIYYIALLPK